LSLVKGLVEMHGGSVEAQSAGAGLGSEFIVRLPLAISAEIPARTTTGQCRSRRGPGRRILVVDDNRDAAASLAMMLSAMGNQTAQAYDGLEALRLGETFLPELIFLDIGMPNLNGYDVALRIRQLPWGQQLLLVALTGWGQEEYRQRSREAGFDHHLVKPIDFAALEVLLATGRAN
jgi:CheY-like chemotaxis protein